MSVLNRRAVAHPEWFDDAVERLRNTLVIQQRHPLPDSIVAFMLSTPAHRLLRAIHGGAWSVAWWALLVALSDLRWRLTPLWWLRLKLGADDELIALVGTTPPADAPAGEGEKP